MVSTQINQQKSKKYFSKIRKEEYEQRFPFSKFIYPSFFDEDEIRDIFDKPITIVDLGSGFSFLEEFLEEKRIIKDKNTQIIGVDLRYGKSLDKGELFTSSFRYTQLAGDVFNLPFKDNFADVVFGINILPYLNDLKFFSEEVNRILKINGILILFQPINSKIKRPLWDMEFNGIKLKFHKGISTFFNSKGFELISKKRKKISFYNNEDISLEFGDVFFFLKDR